MITPKDIKRYAAKLFLRALDTGAEQDAEFAQRIYEAAIAAKRSAAAASLPAPEDDPAASGVYERDSGSWAATVGLYS